MSIVEVDHDQTPASTFHPRAIHGTFSFEVEMPRFARSSFGNVGTGREVLTYSPSNSRFELRDRPHLFFSQASVAGWKVRGKGSRPELSYVVEIRGLSEIVFGARLEYIDEYNEWTTLWERADGQEAAIVRRVWMDTESAKPTINRIGERVAFEGSSSAWHVERGGSS